MFVNTFLKIFSIFFKKFFATIFVGEIIKTTDENTSVVSLLFSSFATPEE